ncbi:hypothetical protein HLB44_01670 [Aquincola sp. S2]|uniref:Uncharacterized protein n=1 Tax=Pseudaquabacterium terrae TaxID=2732868 RepID=A0ABX2EBA3_9BURK|nr:hypothetical protein [Aquabacterium terrae]
MLSVRFDDCGREFELRPAWAAVALPVPDGFDRFEWSEGVSSPWSAAPRWLLRCDARRLRALAEAADGGPGRLPEPQVHAAVARLLQRGRLRLVELRRRRLVDDQRAERAWVSSLVVTPSMLRSARSAAAEPAPTPSAAPALPVAVDADRQAAVLRRAAALGTPFCEECERRRAVALEPA